jgi:DNA repair protein RadD
VLAVLPTGGGKTVCFSYIAQAASIKGNRVLILVHRQELLDQASRAMPAPHGIIAANRAMDLSHTVQVASVQTVARRLHLLPRDFFQLLVVDEAHHTTAGTWAKVIAHFHAAKLLGVTATPIRGDGRGLGEHYQAMVQGPTAAELTSEGYLAPARVLAPPGFDSAGLRKRMGDFDTKQAEQRVGTIMGDCLGHYPQTPIWPDGDRVLLQRGTCRGGGASVPVGWYCRGQHRREHGYQHAAGATAAASGR